MSTLKEKIRSRLSHLSDSDIPDEWNDISGSKQYDLLSFYNVSDEGLSADDLEILADLFNGITGSIEWLDCDDCGAELCVANPNSWASFQGVICENEGIYSQECCIKTMSGETADEQ